MRLLGPELTLQSRLADAKAEVRRCLCDDFDTPGAVGALQELVKAVNKVPQAVARYGDVFSVSPVESGRGSRLGAVAGVAAGVDRWVVACAGASLGVGYCLVERGSRKAWSVLAF